MHIDVELFHDLNGYFILVVDEGPAHLQSFKGCTDGFQRVNVFLVTRECCKYKLYVRLSFSL